MPDSLDHLAIIMDGNGRWGNSNNKERITGYYRGADNAISVTELALELGIKHLSLFAFSMENWSRNDTNFLFDIFLEYFIKYIDLINKKQIRVRFIGEIYLLSQQIQKYIAEAENKTTRNSKMTLNIAISYGGRHEIIAAVKKMISDDIDPSKIDCNLMKDYIYTADIPDPDLIIRTGGQKRLSNFFLWQSAYSELYFCDTLWPDFSKEDLLEAVEDYYKRVRKYGK